jgi:capsular polysaccharide biosynthesis protein
LIDSMTRTPPAHSGTSAAPVAVLARAFWPIVVVTLVVAAATLGISTRLPHTYKANAAVRVTLPDNSSNRGTVSASNALASRYAALIRNPNVVGRVAQQIGDRTSLLNVALTAGTVDGQNVVVVRATAPTAGQALRRANGAARALVYYVRQASDTQLTDYQRTATAQLRLLNDQIRTIQHRIDTSRADAADSSASVVSDQETLSVLQGQKASIQVDNATTAAADVPTVRVVRQALSADKIAPRPLVFTLVALLVTPLLAVQVILLLAAYRRPS